MLVLGIILIAVAIIGAFIYMLVSKDSFSSSVLALLILTLWGTLLLTEYVVEKETATKCLKGNNPYKMEIRYELQDSIYTPIDTVYIKIRQNS